MKHQANVEEILKFEKKYELKKRSINGIHYWYCRRTRTLNDIIATANKQQDMCDKEKIKKIKIFSKNNFIGKLDRNRDILLVTDARRVKQGDKYESIYTDEIEKIVKNEFSCITLEEPSWTSDVHMKESHYYNCNTENIKYTDIYEIIAIIKKFFFKKLNFKEMKKINNEVNKLIEDINEYFEINMWHIKKDFVDHIVYFLVMKKIYANLIKKINPKCACFYYRDFPFKTLLVSILKEKNIPTIEMQHGSFVNDEPIEKKGDGEEEWENIPDYLFSFGEFQTCETNLVYKKEQIKYIGNLFLERKIQEQDGILKGFDKKTKYILVISQSSMGEYISILTSNLAELLEGTNYVLIYKYHPNESGRRYENLNKKNIIQIKDGSEEIYKYQKISYAQIGISSTAVFEGISFNLPTFVLKNPEGFSGMEEILKKFKQGIYFVSNEKEIQQYLKETLINPDKEDIKLLWESNSKENFLKEIRKIIQNS